MSTLPRLNRQPVLAAGLAVTLAAALAACGSGSSKTASTSTTTPASPTGSGPATFPGTSGSVAAITGSSMEVQRQTAGQETVTWTSTTRFSKTATLAASSLSPGVCVMVVGTTSGSAVTAHTVSVSKPSASGGCTGRAGAFGRVARGGGTGNGPPPGSTPPRSFPAGGGSGFASRLADVTIITGKLVSAGSTSMVVDGVKLTGFARRPGPAGSTSTTTVPASDLTVALSSSTAVTEVESATASSLAVGDCVTATGPSDSTGAIAATIIRITSTGGQSCTAGGFGGQFFTGGGSGAG